MVAQPAACVLALVASGLGLMEPPERYPQNQVQFPPAGLEYRWFYLDPGFEEAVRGGASAMVEDEAGAGNRAEDEPAEAAGAGSGDTGEEGGAKTRGIEFPASARTLDEGIVELRESVGRQWPHEREVRTGLDDLELYLRSLGADDAGMLFDGRTAGGFGFLRDVAEHHLVPASGVYAATETLRPGEQPAPRRATPPPAPATPRHVDPALGELTDREAHERVWRTPRGRVVAAIDVANVLVDDEWQIPLSERNPKWPHNGMSSSGTLFSSPATLTMAQRFSEPERP